MRINTLFLKALLPLIATHFFLERQANATTSPTDSNPETELAQNRNDDRQMSPRRPSDSPQQRQQRPNEPQRRRPPPDSATTRSPAPSTQESSNFGVGLQLGWEAPLGNAVLLHFLPSTNFGLFGGLGYNNSGLKFGAGSQLILPIGDSIGFQGGGAFVYSQGTTGSVTLDASFQPEGSSSRESLGASKDYELSSALMGSIFSGLYFKLSESIRLSGVLSYNLVLSGNEVSFGEEIRYDKQVEIINQSSFDEEFERNAESIVQAGGLGFSVGLTLML